MHNTILLGTFMGLQSVPPSTRQPPKTTPPPNLRALSAGDAGGLASTRAKEPRGAVSPCHTACLPPEPTRNPGLSTAQPLEGGGSPSRGHGGSPAFFPADAGRQRGALTSQSRLAAAAFLGPFLPAVRGRDPRSSDIAAAGRGGSDAAARTGFARPALRAGAERGLLPPPLPPLPPPPPFSSQNSNATPAPVRLSVREEPLPSPSLRAAGDTGTPPTLL